MKYIKTFEEETITPYQIGDCVKVKIPFGGGAYYFEAKIINIHIDRWPGQDKKDVYKLKGILVDGESIIDHSCLLEDIVGKLSVDRVEELEIKLSAQKYNL